MLSDEAGLRADRSSGLGH